MSTDIAQMLQTPEGFITIAHEAGSVGRKKRAEAALQQWRAADQQLIYPCVVMYPPGGTGSGRELYIYWDPERVQPNLSEISAAVRTLPAKESQVNEKVMWKGRDKKSFFSWVGASKTELCQSFLDRFGVYAFASTRFESENPTNVMVIAVKDGVDHILAGAV